MSRGSFALEEVADMARAVVRAWRVCACRHRMWPRRKHEEGCQKEIGAGVCGVGAVARGGVLDRRGCRPSVVQPAAGRQLGFGGGRGRGAGDGRGFILFARPPLPSHFLCSDLSTPHPKYSLSPDVF